MGQCSSENSVSCRTELCNRSYAAKLSCPPAPLGDEVETGDEETRTSAAELPPQLLGAASKAAAAAQAPQLKRDTLATLTVPRCKSKGVQTEPTPETTVLPVVVGVPKLRPAGEVLPETFFVPDGEPWELALSTAGSYRDISEMDMLPAGDSRGLAGSSLGGHDAYDAFFMPVESPALRGRRVPPTLNTEDLAMAGLLPDPSRDISVSSSRSSLTAPSLLRRGSGAGPPALRLPELAEDLAMAGLLPDPSRTTLASMSSSRSSLTAPFPPPRQHRGPGGPALAETLERPEEEAVSDSHGSIQGLHPDFATLLPFSPQVSPGEEEAACVNPLSDEADARRFLAEHEGVWLNCSDQVPVAALKDQKIWKKELPHPTAVTGLPGHRVQIPGHTARISFGPPPQLQWSDGSSWVREELQGRWSSSVNRKYTLLVRDWKVFWDAKMHAAPTTLARMAIFPKTTVTMFLDRECRAVYEPGPPAKLEWSDGEVWTRLSFEEATTSIAPARPAARMLP